MATKFRGAQIHPTNPAKDILDLSKHNPNLVRFEFMGDLFDAAMDKLEAVLQATKLAGISVIISYHRPVGNPVTNTYDRAVLQTHWSRLLAYGNEFPHVKGYGILNEPAGSNSQVTKFEQNMYAFMRARTDKVLCLTCRWSSPADFGHTWHAPNDDKIWYEAHMYLPMRLTHQGIAGRKYPVRYPYGDLNKQRLELLVSGIRLYQQKHHAHIYIGEFGISAYASPASREQYLQDCISIFEKYGWNWTYHAWREAPVWDIENTIAFDPVADAWQKNL